MENYHSELNPNLSSRLAFQSNSNGISASIQTKEKHSYPKTDIIKNAKYQTFYYADGAKSNRKTFAFWTVISVLFIVTILNLLLTLAIIHVLRLGKGINGIELIPGENLIKFYGITDFESIISRSFIETQGFKNQPIMFESSASNVNIRLYRNGQFMNRMVLDNSGISLRALNSFELKDATSGTTIFTTHRPQYNIPQGAENLITKSISASKIESPIEENLNLEGDERIFLKGSEGIKMDSYGTFLQAENVIFNSTQNTILRSSNIFLNVDRIPIAVSDFGLLRSGNPSYKICVCMPKGTLFRILVPRSYNGPKVSCNLMNLSFDPCLSTDY